MVAGTWTNQDGLYLQFGTQKAIPEVGGDFLAYGETRLMETYISLATTQWSGLVAGAAPQVPALPSSFSGTTTAIAAGIQSLTTLFPLQTTAPILTATGGNGLVLNQKQIWIDRVELECLVSANAGTGGATGLTGIGLAFLNPLTQAFVQVTPNAGTQLMGAVTNAQMTAGNKWTFWPVAASAAMTAFPTTTPPTGGNWGGNLPLVTNAVTFPQLASPENPTGLPQWGYISAIASGGTFTGTTAAGLLKLRVFYNIYGNIAQ
jgi:hypothetical protein